MHPSVHPCTLDMESASPAPSSGSAAWGLAHPLDRVFAYGNDEHLDGQPPLGPPRNPSRAHPRPRLDGLCVSNGVLQYSCPLCGITGRQLAWHHPTVPLERLPKLHQDECKPSPQSILSFDDNLILCIALGVNGTLSVPVKVSSSSSPIMIGLGDHTKSHSNYGGPLAFLSCCSQLRRITIPLRITQPQFHLRDWGSSLRFDVLESVLMGDAIEENRLVSVVSNAAHLVSVSLSLCRTLADLTPLTNAKFLRVLTLSECHKISDLSPLTLCVALEHKLLG